MKFIFPPEILNDTYAEIDAGILRKNLQNIRSFVNKRSSARVKICSVVKANAYGHGMCGTALLLSQAGADYLGTADYSESIELRKFLRKNFKKEVPILCLGILTEPKKFFSEVVKYNIEPTFSDVEMARKFNDFLQSINKRWNIHIQVDTGMNRIGFPVENAFAAITEISKLQFLSMNGIYSHFATSEIKNHSFAKSQQKKFIELVKDLQQCGIEFKLKHIENTGGIINYRNDFFNMVRPGISLYGYYPSFGSKDFLKIKPVMTLRTKVSMIKTVPAGRSISYGRKFFTKHDTKIASLPVGYGDGYSRLLTNKSKVFIKGKTYPTAGTVCMDWIMADLGRSTNIKMNDKVEVFGRNYTADELAKIIGTIPYEIICNISPRVQRVYVN